jgi:hypothetical protein
VRIPRRASPPPDIAQIEYQQGVIAMQDMLQATCAPWSLVLWPCHG